jgi:hypothetical protein
MQELITAEGGVEDLLFTKYLIRIATLLRDHLQTNVSDDSIRKDMADVVLFMQNLSRVSDKAFFTYGANPVVHSINGDEVS